MIYNLWLNDEGIFELNFDDDDEVCLNLYTDILTSFSVFPFAVSQILCFIIFKEIMFPLPVDAGYKAER